MDVFQVSMQVSFQAELLLTKVTFKGFSFCVLFQKMPFVSKICGKLLITFQTVILIWSAMSIEMILKSVLICKFCHANVASQGK